MNTENSPANQKYFISSCLYVYLFPETCLKIQKYIQTKSDIQVVRCCLPDYNVQGSEERITVPEVQQAWKSLPITGNFVPGDTVYTLCHNCTNIVEEMHPGVRAVSLWELIDQDDSFVFPDYTGLKVTLQDCWRTRERRSEQDAVRSLLRKMNIEYIDAREHHEQSDFCGSTLYRPQLAKNSDNAPKHYVEQAKGKFLPHTREEQIAIMKEYCSQFTTETVVCYCHYCLGGLNEGGVDGRHIASLLFP